MLEAIGWIPAHRFLFAELRVHFAGDFLIAPFMRALKRGYVHFGSIAIEPLVPSQEINQSKTKSRTIERPACLLQIWNSGGTKFLWVPQLGAPTVGGPADLTVVEINT
jgi:hypothetical protein